MSAGAAAAIHAAQEAIRASGAIVQVEPELFLSLLAKVERPLVVHAVGGFLTRSHRYLMGHRGLVFFTKSDAPLELAPRIDLIEARKITVPDL